MNALRRATAVSLAVLATLAVLGPAAVGPAAASTPPQSLCPVCGPNLDRASENAGVDVTAERSTVVMNVSRSGDARFTARVRVDDASARTLRGNESAVDALVGTAFEESYDVRGLDRATDVTSSFGDDTLVVSWTVPDVARDGPGGTLLVTMLGEYRYGIALHADRLVMHGPEGWAVANGPKTGVVQSTGGSDDDGRTSGTAERVVWRASADYDAQAHLEAGTYVAFAPSDGLGARAGAELAVASAIGPTMLSHAAIAGGPSAAVLAGALLACLFVLDGSPRPGRDAHWLAVLGTLAAVVGLAFAVVEGHGPLADRNIGLLALPAGVAAFGWLTARTPAVANLREAALRAAGTVGVGGAVAVALSGDFLSFAAAIFTVTVGGFYLVGVYDQRVGWPVAAVSLAVVATPLVGVLPATPVGGFGPGIFVVVLTPVAVAAALVGVAAYRIGAGKQVTGERVVDATTAAS